MKEVNFEYTNIDYVDEKLEYIGCADVTLEKNIFRRVMRKI